MDEKEIVYIPYGQDEINQQEFLNAAANDVQSYVNSRAWSRKRKESFLNAYQDIMSRGITGASNESGIWKINHKGAPIDLDSKSKTDKEMYQAAAYYIQQKMMGVTPRTKTEKKEELTPFDNDTLFKTYLMNNYYGGSKDLDIASQWDYLDPRDSTGKRGTSERKKRMIEILTGYRDSIGNGEKYSFENTPFKDVTDFRNRINNAITALNTDDENDDIDAFNRLGLNSRQWFSNGLGDLSGQTLNGQELTYNQLNQYNQALAKKKAEEEAAQLKAKNEAAKQAAYKNTAFFRTVKANFPATTAEQLKEKYGDQNQLIAALNQYSQANIQDLSSDQKRELFGAMKLAQNNVSDDIYKKLINTPTYKGSARNRFKSINGVDNYIYDTKTGNVIQVQNREQFENGNTPTSDLFSGVKSKEELRQQAADRKLSEGFETEDYLRMGAMAQDIAGGITAWAGPYGMAASGILGLTSLGTNMAADIADESMSGWDVAKNAGVNLGLAAVGMVPGLGLASKTGKWITNIAKWAPRLLTLQAIKDLPESYNALQKAISNPKELTNTDWKNIAYGLSIAAGLSRGTKGIVNNRKYKPTVTQNTETETFITTKSGNKIKATQKDVDAINKAGRKGGNDKANEELRKLPGAKADDEVNINFKTGTKGKIDPTNKIKLDSSTKNIGQSPEVQRYSRALAIKNIRDKAAHPFLSKYLPTNYDIYQSAARVSAPNINIVDRIKQAWNPVPNRPFKGTKQQNQSSSTPTGSNTKPTPTGFNAKPKPSVLSKEDSKELQSTLRGKNFSNNEFKDESRVVGSIKGFGDLYGVRNSDGTHTLQIDFGGTRVNVTGTKADIKSKTLEVLRKDVMKKIDSQVPKENRSKIKFELIKQLKANGYLKQGGTIDKQKIQKYKEFIKK